jgi:hypothetical protein
MIPNAFRLAFGFSVAAFLNIVAGLMGYTFRRQVGQPWGHWTGTLVWWEVWLGVACAVIAAISRRRRCSDVVNCCLLWRRPCYRCRMRSRIKLVARIGAMTVAVYAIGAFLSFVC